MERTNKPNISMNIDTTPILYTDNVTIVVNEDGVTVNFLQRVGNGRDQHIVSRIGMSRTHAKKLASHLAKLLGMTEPVPTPGKKN